MLNRPLLRRQLIRYWEQKGKRYSAAILATFFAICQSALVITPFGNQLELAIVDRWFELRGARAAPEEIVIASIDERSFAALGESTLLPMPRTRIAEALYKLRDYAVRGVFIDIIFAEHSKTPEEENLLADALSSVKSFIATGDISDGYWQKALSNTENRDRLRPLPIFLEAATGILTVDVPSDDSVIRRFPHMIDLFCRLLNQSKILNQPLETCPARTDLINFLGPAHTMKEISFSELLQQNFPADRVKDKFVYIGLGRKIGAGLTTKDTFSTPYRREVTAGVEIQATVLENLLRQNWIKRSAIELENPLLASVCFLSVIFLLSVNTWMSVLFGFITICGWLALSYRCFIAGVLLPGASFFIFMLPIMVFLLILKKLFTAYLNQKRLVQLSEILAEE